MVHIVIRDLQSYGAYGKSSLSCLHACNNNNATSYVGVLLWYAYTFRYVNVCAFSNNGYAVNHSGLSTNNSDVSMCVYIF